MRRNPWKQANDKSRPWASAVFYLIRVDEICVTIIPMMWYINIMHGIPWKIDVSAKWVWIAHEHTLNTRENVNSILFFNRLRWYFGRSFSIDYALKFLSFPPIRSNKSSRRTFSVRRAPVCIKCGLNGNPFIYPRPPLHCLSPSLLWSYDWHIHIILCWCEMKMHNFGPLLPKEEV